ncbi:ATP-binding protein [Natrarchaeobius sp. A-rgal3]|uniref:sensor histidine kinase n=1 Tax=Natrarchaeobius versutus TaxID=1679078 RepID=UPI0035103CD6
MTSREPDALVPLAVDTLPINVAILDEEGVILYTNRAWREFGQANDIDFRPDTIGIDYLEVAEQSGGETAQAVADGLREILAGERELLEIEYPCHSPEAKRWFLMRAAPFTDDERRYVAVAHFDVTDRHEYRRRLERSNERLEQFAYAVSHDLREPLRMVSQYLRLLEDRYGDELDAEADEFIEFAVDGAERMGAMIDGLLTYSRVESRGDPTEPVDLESVVDDALADLDVRIAETDADVSVDSLPVVEGDGNQLRRLFQNLLDNAIQYSGDGAPVVTIEAERNDADRGSDVTASEDGEEWIVSVSDEGIGIAPADEDRVFDVFQRLHSTEEYPGTGIGLAVCRRIVERHGGEIWIEPGPDGGTTFSFTLPAANARNV